MDDLISKLSEIRSRYNCFDEDEEPYYRALSEAIMILSQREDGDTIGRQAAIDAIKEWGLLDGLSEGQAIEILGDEEKVPSAQPYALDEWCDTCKEYDSERHCCPRYNRVIRDAMKMRKRGKWIIGKDATGATYGRCSVCGIKQYAGHMNFCYECGADMRGKQNG